MRRTMLLSLAILSSLAVAATVVIGAGGAAPADAATLKQRNKATASTGTKKRFKTKSEAQRDKAHPNHIDVLSWSWGMSQGGSSSKPGSSKSLRAR